MKLFVVCQESNPVQVNLYLNVMEVSDSSLRYFNVISSRFNNDLNI